MRQPRAASVSVSIAPPCVEPSSRADRRCDCSSMGHRRRPCQHARMFGLDGEASALTIHGGFVEWLLSPADFRLPISAIEGARRCARMPRTEETATALAAANRRRFSAGQGRLAAEWTGLPNASGLSRARWAAASSSRSIVQPHWRSATSAGVQVIGPIYSAFEARDPPRARRSNQGHAAPPGDPKLWSHPTLGEYIWKRLRHAVR